MNRRSAGMHADWLRLVEPEGQFLTLPVLRRSFPNGLDALEGGVREALRNRYPKDSKPSQKQWDAWITWLLRDVLKWGPYFLSGSEVGTYAREIPEHGVILRATDILRDPHTGKARAIVMRYPHGTVLDKRIKSDRWNTSPIDRIKELCKSHGVRLGLVTDGERIALVWVPNVGTGGFATWDTMLFTESREREVFRSFVSLLHAHRFFSMQEDGQIESLFEASERAQSEVTDQLGFQIRQAVELLVNALSRANLERNGRLLSGIPPQRVYEGAVTVMMRLVFLLYAEERDLLPLSEPIYSDFYAVSTLREQLEEQASLEGDEPLERRNAAWYRLLATFRVIYAGLSHDRLSLPAYGGRLFDPDRFPFLEGRPPKESWYNTASHPMPVDDLTVKAMLEAIQTLPIRDNGSNERRRLSFRSLDVEQIGHVYEGLLDHGAVRVDEVYVGLVGKSGDEAEISLAEIEQAAGKGDRQLLALLVEKTRRSESAIQKFLQSGKELVDGGDAETRRLLNTVCDNDTTLTNRIAPYVYALRKDLHGVPVVFNPGSLVVKQTRTRRDSGTEYTPRELAEEMVQHELEPLVYSPGLRDGDEPSKWKLRPSKELLDLKICDPAVGSGAFLVSACRYLADRVVEAWIEEDPQRENLNRDDLTLNARRAVVDRCLYGVDRDSMAVEMAKLSLWLVTMAKEKPFSFLDHSIREGDSLLGIRSLDQVLYVHMNPDLGRVLHDGSLFDVTSTVTPLVGQAARLRSELEALPSVSIRDAETKQRLNDEANATISIVSVVADAIVATALSTATDSGKRRDAAFVELAIRIREALEGAANGKVQTSKIDALRSFSEQLLNQARPEHTPVRKTLHWPLIFPEVFSAQRSGFDALIGNPPFVGGQKIGGSFGSDYRSYLVEYVGNGARGNADLVAFFFLRAASLAKTFAFLAVNTIAQGDTREVGLDKLVSSGWKVVRAVKSREWPGEAGVHISQIWMSKIAEHQPSILDGICVNGISSLLTIEERANGNPWPLSANSGIAFIGSYVLGMGFTMASEDADALIKARSTNRDVLFPYISADDVCKLPGPTPGRWIINFFDWPIERAKKYEACFQIVEEKVKPERDGSTVATVRNKWWIYARPRLPYLYASIANLKHVIAMPLTSKVMLPVMLDTGAVFDQTLVVMATDSMFMFGMLSSTVHRAWARKYGGTLTTRPRYIQTDCFETFPFPAANSDVERLGTILSQARSKVSADAKIGLTKIYNRVHNPSDNDPEIEELRRLHRDLDIAVCNSYGWNDLELNYGFHATNEGTRWTICNATLNEILERLLELNHDRYGRQTQANAVSPKPVSSNGKRGRKASSPSHELQISLMMDGNG